MSDRRQERKVVTVLFADLVGFTSRAEEMDPEDVVGILRPYHERLRSEPERFGGTVEKFIGDAVMAVFGAPVAHEDDPERAVRAAIAIRDWIADEGEELQLRIAVNTGEALVNLDARPELGEAMAGGDVVNTAARLQSGAPVNGILVGEATYRATRETIDYREAAPVPAKGKAKPVPVWEAVEARSRLGVDVVQEGRTPLVGRQRELEVLVQAFGRARSERTSQLVTVIGVPGIGKSRLAWELFQAIESEPELVFWRQGRCLPYGDGVAFWAVGEMVKADAGILDTDSAEATAAKLERAAEAAGDDADWVAGHLRPLVGLAEDATADRRQEAFAAWRRFFEGLAEQSPLVLVFEDLHWADEGVLEFVDHLVDWTTGVPLLVVATARPEFLERRPGWGGGKLNATTLALAPLSDEDAARLVADLTGRSVLPAETQAALLARAGGNPLYAEQYVRMLAERATAENLPLPETVQGIIAARLDTLAADEKVALQDAAVIGKVFWPAALRALGEAGRDLDQLLHGLARKEFVRRERRSTVVGEQEYAFRHFLVRDVAYGQIPRARRAEKHRLAAEWIESLSERTEDVAEMLAHHYSSALELALAAGQETAEVAVRARLALRAAGVRALALGAFEPAATFLTRALELWPSDDPDRPELQLTLCRALSWGGPSEELLVEARDGLLRQGKSGKAARAESMLAGFWWNLGRRKESRRHLDAARRLIEDAPASLDKADTLRRIGAIHLAGGDDAAALAAATAELEIAETLGFDDHRAQALNTIGMARFGSGDPEGLRDVERSLELAERLSSAEAIIRGYKNLGDGALRKGDLAGALKLHERGLAVARRFGDRFHATWFRAERALDFYLLGRWSEARPAAEQVLHELEAADAVHYNESACRYVVAFVRLAAGDFSTALRETERMLVYGRSVRDRQVLLPALAARARVVLAAGDREEAKTVVAEAVEGDDRAEVPGPSIADLAFAAAVLELPLTGVDPVRSSWQSPWLVAAEAMRRRDFLGAAAVYAELGARTNEAEARLLAAQSFAAAGRRPEADQQLRRALAFFREVGATAYVRDAEALLAASA